MSMTTTFTFNTMLAQIVPNSVFPTIKRDVNWLLGFHICENGLVLFLARISLEFNNGNHYWQGCLPLHESGAMASNRGMKVLSDVWY